MKLSEFLLTSVPTHSICDHQGLAEEFTKETGQQPCWPTHTQEDARIDLIARGLGGETTIEADKPGRPVAYGWEIACAVANTHVPGGFRSSKLGRGSQYRQAIEALEAAGL